MVLPVAQEIALAAARLQRLHQQLMQHLDSERESQNRISELEKALRERDEALAGALADLQKEKAGRAAAEEELRAAGDLGSRLEANSCLLEKAKETFKRALEEVEKRLEAAQSALRQSESSLQNEASERLRLQEVLAAGERKLQEQADNAQLEKSKLETALQLEEVERKRLEADLLRSRQATRQSAFQSRALLNSLRQQARQPAKDVRQAACSLLQAELPEDQKKVIETILEKALLLETTLQGNASPIGDIESPASEKERGDDAVSASPVAIAEP